MERNLVVLSDIIGLSSGLLNCLGKCVPFAPRILGNHGSWQRVPLHIAIMRGIVNQRARLVKWPYCTQPARYANWGCCVKTAGNSDAATNLSPDDNPK